MGFRSSRELARQVPGYEIRDLLEATIGGNTQRAALAAPRKASDSRVADNALLEGRR